MCYLGWVKSSCAVSSLPQCGQLMDGAFGKTDFVIVFTNVLLGALHTLMKSDLDKVAVQQDTTKGNMYRVIHPVLKSLALRKLGL